MKPYHKMAFKDAEKAPQKPRKCLKNCHFAAINIEINFGLDRCWICWEWVSGITFPLQRYFFFEATDAPRSEDNGRSREVTKPRSRALCFSVKYLTIVPRRYEASAPRSQGRSCEGRRPFRSDDISVLLSRAKLRRSAETPLISRSEPEPIYTKYISYSSQDRYPHVHLSFLFQCEIFNMYIVITNFMVWPRPKAEG